MTPSESGNGQRPPRNAADLGPTGVSSSELGDGRMAPFVSRIASGLHALSIVAVTALILLTLTDVVGRGVFGQPVRGTVEMTELLIALVVFLALARTEEMDEHVTVDLVFNLLGPRAQRVIRGTSHLVMVSLLLFLAWRMALQGLHLRAVTLTTGVLGLAVWPVLMVGVVGMLGYAMVMVARALVELRRPLSVGPDPDAGLTHPPVDAETGEGDT